MMSSAKRFGAFGIVSVPLGALRRWRKVCQKRVVKSNFPLLDRARGSGGWVGGERTTRKASACPLVWAPSRGITSVARVTGTGPFAAHRAPGNVRAIEGGGLILCFGDVGLGAWA